MGARKEQRDLLHFHRKADHEQGPTIMRDLMRRAVELERHPRNPLPPRKAPTAPSKAAVRRWMRLNAGEYETATELAEGCNAAFDLPQEWLDDESHWVWEIAATEIELAVEGR